MKNPKRINVPRSSVETYRYFTAKLAYDMEYYQKIKLQYFELRLCPQNRSIYEQNVLKRLARKEFFCPEILKS